MIFFDDGSYEEYYEHINLTIIYGNMMNMSLIIMEGKYSAIGADASSCYGYYIINFSSTTYTLQLYLRIDGQVIYYDEMVYEGSYSFQINTN